MPPLTLAHVIISLIGIVTGVIVGLGMLSSKRMDGMTAVFLTFTILTSVTGFVFFPFTFANITPGDVIGAISLVALAIALVARYAKGMAGPWRAVFVITAMLAEWFNVFVLVVQLYEKVPTLHALDPTRSGAPFKATQGVVLLIFLVWTILAVNKFQPASAAAAA